MKNKLDGMMFNAERRRELACFVSLESRWLINKPKKSLSINMDFLFSEKALDCETTRNQINVIGVLEPKTN